MKHFIIVGKTCQSKNKVQKLILEHLQKLDQTLWASIEQASEATKKAYENALKEYNGKASIPDLRSFVPQGHQLTLFVEDLIYVNVYAVKKYKP